MPDIILNKILNKLSTKIRKFKESASQYDEKIQAAYNSTFNSKMATRLFFGGFCQIILIACLATLVKNPIFSFMKNIITPISGTIILAPISLGIGELVRKYLSKGFAKTCKKLNITNSTPDYVKKAHEIENTVLWSIAKKKSEIYEEVEQKIKEAQTTSSTSKNLASLIADNTRLESELKSKITELENIICEQVLCCEYKLNRTKFREIIDSLFKATGLTTAIMMTMLVGIILIAINYFVTIPNQEFEFTNLIKNIISCFWVSVPSLGLYFFRDYKLRDYAILSLGKKSSVSANNEDKDESHGISFNEIYQKIKEQYKDKSSSTLKRSFDSKIKQLTDDIISLETAIQTNNIALAITRKKNRATSNPKKIKEKKTKY